MGSRRSRELLSRAGALSVAASLFDPEALRRAVAGHDVVVNVATHIPVGFAAILPRAWSEDDRIRTEGSRLLVDAALRNRVDRFLQEAVTFVYADHGDEWITEQTIPAPNPRSQAAATMVAAADAARITAVVAALGCPAGIHNVCEPPVLRSACRAAGRERIAEHQLALPKARRSAHLGNGEDRPAMPSLKLSPRKTLTD